MISFNPRLRSHIRTARAMMRSVALVAVSSFLMVNDALSQSEPECPIYRVTLEGKGSTEYPIMNTFVYNKTEQIYEYKKTDCKKGYEGNWWLVKYTYINKGLSGFRNDNLPYFQ